MPSGSVFTKDGLCCRVVDAEDFGGSVNTKALFDNKFDKFFSGLNDGIFYLDCYFFVVGL